MTWPTAIPPAGIYTARALANAHAQWLLNKNLTAPRSFSSCRMVVGGAAGQAAYRILVIKHAGFVYAHSRRSAAGDGTLQ